MEITRRKFMASAAAFAVSPALAADGRRMKTPLMLDMKRMAIWDGPGMRTTFFVKGCPLKCIWCHNPEGISTRAEKMYNRKKCIGCSGSNLVPRACYTWLVCL